MLSAHGSRHTVHGYHSKSYDIILPCAWRREPCAGFFNVVPLNDRNLSNAWIRSCYPILSTNPPPVSPAAQPPQSK
jgi:hypothetical protein